MVSLSGVEGLSGTKDLRLRSDRQTDINYKSGLDQKSLIFVLKSYAFEVLFLISITSLLT